MAMPHGAPNSFDVPASVVTTPDIVTRSTSAAP